MTAARFVPLLAVGALALATATTAAAEPLATVAKARLDASLPPSLTLAAVHLTARLAVLDVDPATVAVTWSRAPRVGTVSVRLSWGARQTRFVPVTLAARVADPDRARALTAVASAPPLPRGTSVMVESRRGAVLITGRGTLEHDGSLGTIVLVRLLPDRLPVRGLMVAADRVVIAGDEVAP